MVRVTEPSTPRAVQTAPSAKFEQVALSQSFGSLALRKPRWLIPDVLERGVVALMAGPRGSYKSFVALHWTMDVAARQGLPVYVVTAEGGDYRRRGNAWLQEFAPELSADAIPLHVVERRIDLNATDNVELIRADCVRLGVRPVLFVLDTLSKLSGGLDENSNTECKAFIGRLDNGLKRAFDATVLLIAHTGHSDKGRVRGASALEADTDACYVATRDSQTVRVSRDRFKESPELPPLAYAARVVDVAIDGETATSLVLDATTKARGASEPTKLGPNERAIVAALKMHSPTAPMDQVRVIALVIDAQGLGKSTRAQRESAIGSAIRTAIGKGVIFSHGDNLIALTSAVEVSNFEGGDE